ncbi:MAG: carbohydrate ABC transporter permease [Puniceicoccales bacterium]
MDNHQSSQQLNRARRRAKFLQKSKLFLSLYLLVLPTTLSLLVFSYYPKIDVVIMSFFRWEPPTVEEYIGFENFIRAFKDPRFWQSFQLVGILLVANLLKLWPGIFAAIALHRLANDKLRYFFQVCFVVPMIIPGMVFLLIWKSFYEPEFGLVNRFLNITGLMNVLDWLDGIMPSIASTLEPLSQTVINPVFGGVGGIVLLGAIVITFGFRKERNQARFGDFLWILIGSLLFPIFSGAGLLSSATGWLSLFGVLVVWMIVGSRRMSGSWVIWPFILLAGVLVFWGGAMLRLPILLLVGIGVFEVIRAKRGFFTGRPLQTYIGMAIITIGSLLIIFGSIWTSPIGQFADGKPAWLGNKDLVIPAILFWGFPWVGTVGVLIYLSGLQNISEDIYEAARLDGVSPMGMIFRIELPLIMTQVRINIIFMTIGTLVTYEIFFILLGVDGGPGNKGLVPGLYMFQSAFVDGQFGYACALGMVLFVIILLLTIINQKFVKVDK